MKLLIHGFGKLKEAINKMIPFWFIIAYPVILLSSIIFLLFAMKKYGHFSLLRRTMSGLGGEHKKSQIYFDISMILVGLGTIILAYFLNLKLPNTIENIIMTFAMVMACVGTIFVSFFPESFRKKDKLVTHYMTAGTAFAGFFIAALFFSIIILTTNISNWLLIFPILVILSLIGCSHTIKYNKPYYPGIKRKFMKNINIWEWFSIISIFIWVISLYLILSFI